MLSRDEKIAIGKSRIHEAMGHAVQARDKLYLVKSDFGGLGITRHEQGTLGIVKQLESILIEIRHLLEGMQ